MKSLTNKLSMITEQEIYRRRDMRDVFTFTIDPADAKDFDDAISYLRLENGNYQIGVHIADVTHFVLPGSEIDIVAYEKATSVYLVDEVFPMLPEALCNDLCSLRPNEEKLCMSIVFDISPDAHVIKHKVSRTVIKSDCRLSYEQADDLLKDKAVVIVPTIEKELKESLKELNVLAKQFRQKRIAKGALELEQEEMRFRLDENKFPIEIYFEQSTDAHQLIEEFMLLANRTIATLLAQSVPMVYRVHDLPNKEKMALLKRFTKRRGDAIPASTIKMLTMRAMAKAVYATHNIGHYGLAFDYYTHFTSPIRRYPDMMVHRLVSIYLLGERKASELITPYAHYKDVEQVETACQHCTDMEVAATTAERDSIKYMQVLWLQSFVGQEFDGVISSVTDFGLFVQLNDSHCEGLIPIRTLSPTEHLVYDERNYRLISKPNTRIRRGHFSELPTPIKALEFTLGDKVRVRVVKADVNRRLVDFELISHEKV